MRMMLPNFGRMGVNKDLPPYELPPGYLSDINNFVIRDGRLRSAPGYEETFTGAPIAPFFAQAIDEFWIYAGQDKIYVIDATNTHTNITRQNLVPADVDYSGTESDTWTGCTFNGIPILCNGVDAPQYWALPLATSTKLADLPYDSGNSWDDLSYSAQVIRPFRNYLIALSVQKTDFDPHMVKWSHAAVPGSLPADWDETDDTLDAGEFSLTAGEDVILDGGQLDRHFVIYKERSSWLMRYVGGGSIMAFDKLFPSKGILARRCFCEIPGGRHLVVSEDDIYIHDGTPNWVSVGNNIIRRYFNTNLDSANFRKVQCMPFPAERQVWVIFPETAQSQCTKAAIWNWDSGQWTLRDVPSIESLAVGVVDSELTYEGLGTLEYEDAVFPYDQSGTQGKSAVMIMLDAVNSKFFLTNVNDLDDGVAVRKYAERQSIPIQRQGNQGRAMLDLESVRTVTMLIPKVECDPANTDLSIYVGTQMKPEDSVTWSSAYTYNPSTDDHVDVRATGRLLSLRIEATDDVSFFVDGFEINHEFAGLR